MEKLANYKHQDKPNFTKSVLPVITKLYPISLDMMTPQSANTQYSFANFFFSFLFFLAPEACVQTSAWYYRIIFLMLYVDKQTKMSHLMLHHFPPLLFSSYFILAPS